jgi:hypothetical protein
MATSAVAIGFSAAASVFWAGGVLQLASRNTTVANREKDAFFIFLVIKTLIKDKLVSVWVWQARPGLAPGNDWPQNSWVESRWLRRGLGLGRPPGRDGRRPVGQARPKWVFGRGWDAAKAGRGIAGQLAKEGRQWGSEWKIECVFHFLQIWVFCHFVLPKTKVGLGVC